MLLTPILLSKCLIDTSHRGGLHVKCIAARGTSFHFWKPPYDEAEEAQARSIATAHAAKELLSTDSQHAAGLQVAMIKLTLLKGHGAVNIQEEILDMYCRHAAPAAHWGLC